MTDRKRVGVISLGCDKNRVDTEKMLAHIKQKHDLVDDIECAEIIVINTCAFLESAREEAVSEIFAANEYKKQGSAKKIIVTGCLPQKFIGEIYDELPEVDAFLGVSDYDNILQVIDRVCAGERVNAVGEPRGECGKQRVLTTSTYAYLKVADGCSNHCTYCLIPYIRGKFRSVPTQDLLEEVKGLGKVKELILVAQDTAKYGLDLPEKTNLSELIRKITALDSVGAVRLMYCYPENLTDELIAEIKNNDKVIKYIDIPLQHADDKVLKLMNRKGTGAGYLELINKLKSEIPDIAIRSTFITGFPRESEQAFKNLVDFIKKAKLFNAGFFAYSREEGTPAYRLDGQIDEKIKQKRLKKLYSVQQKVVEETNQQFIDKVITVTAEGFDQNEMVYFGRAYFNAPDIDGKVYFFSADEVERGQSYQVKITQVTGYDLYGERL
ncbi:MAG: 30S ribosomal protein S12 methylthiotransferase RimO [Clostridiales bacterium]|nr:30S ribosomal protein S12 methylthiotransferase RimO [Clostridiales bacterium]